MRRSLSIGMLLAIAWSLPLHATIGNETQNGGFVALCSTNNTPAEIYFLDYYVYTRQLRPTDPVLVLPPVLGSPLQKAREVVQRFAEISPDLGAVYLNYLDHFESQVVWVAEMPANVTNDIGNLAISIIDSSHPKCLSRQMIIQSRHDSQVRYYINKGLWDNLNDNNQKAIAILHEIVLRDMVDKSKFLSNTSDVQKLVIYMLLYSANGQLPFTP
ncbi:MAG TPA: hypothetical protein VF412_06150 [Bdellovibrio sp.]|uniref:hypothetical protein n=1 Tax=Bdellovibrio sp. TaxID=28201 RepID=UPI002EFF5CEA